MPRKKISTLAITVSVATTAKSTQKASTRRLSTPSKSAGSTSGSDRPRGGLECLGGFAGAHDVTVADRPPVVLGLGLHRQEHLEVLRDRGWLRDDVPFDELAETAAVLCSVEIYLRMTLLDGGSVDAYRRWCRRMLAETVFAR